MGLTHRHQHQRKNSQISLTGWQQLTDKLAYAGGILMPIMTLPQLWKIIQTHNVSSLSLLSWVAYVVGVLFWFVYGLAHKQRVIIVTYGISVIIYGLVVIAILVYR